MNPEVLDTPQRDIGYEIRKLPFCWHGLRTRCLLHTGRRVVDFWRRKRHIDAES